MTLPADAPPLRFVSVPTLNSDDAATHRLALRVYEPAARAVGAAADAAERSVVDVMCVHGVARCGSDFYALATYLAGTGAFRVHVVDMVGRGDSDYLEDSRLYAVPQYAADLLALLRAERLERVLWIGTSMGGLVGMAIAAMPDSPIALLVLNDVGPRVPKGTTAGVMKYMADEAAFATWAECVAYARQTYAAWGDLDDEQWAHVARGTFRDTGAGFVKQYDLHICDNFRLITDEGIDISAVWEAIKCPVCVLWGQRSPILTDACVQYMQSSHPDVQVRPFPTFGHAPSLLVRDQWHTIEAWLRDFLASRA